MFEYKNDGKTGSIKVSFIPFYPFFTGLILMLVMGGLHNEVGNNIPAISYWLSVGITAVVQLFAWLINKAINAALPN